MKQEYIYMNVIAPAFILLPVAIAFLKYGALSKPARLLLGYLLIDTLVSILSSALAFYHIANTPLYHIATMIETVLLLYFFYGIFQQKYFARYIPWAMVLFPVACIINTLCFQHILEFNSYTLSLQSLLIILLCFLYWWHYENELAKPWAGVPLNWIISGLLLYFSSSFLLFTFSNAALTYLSVKNFILVWNIHATLSVVMYIFIGIGFSKYQK